MIGLGKLEVIVLSMARQVNATTWPRRHEGTFGDLGQWLEKLGMASPAVLEIGPGAVTTILRDRLRPGEGEKLSWLANRYRAFLRNLDGLLRRIPGVTLCSYEPGELAAVLPTGSKHFVCDISSAVIEAIAVQYPGVKACVYDFSAGPFGESVDVIVCLCVLVRAREPKAIYANLYRSLKPGGLLVMDNRSCTSFGTPEMPVEKLAPQVWRKPL